MRSASLNVTWTSWLVDVAPVAVASGDAVGAGTVGAADAIGLVSAGAGVDAVARGEPADAREGPRFGSIALAGLNARA